MTISSKNNDHLQGAEVHCFKPTLCVPFVEKNSDITAQKSGDEDIYEMMHFEDKSENVSICFLHCVSTQPSIFVSAANLKEGA